MFPIYEREIRLFPSLGEVRGSVIKRNARNRHVSGEYVSLVKYTRTKKKRRVAYKDSYKGYNVILRYKGGSRGGDRGSGPPPPWNFGKKVVIRFVIGTGLILHSIYVNYSHKSKKGSKCGDLMVRT